MILQTSAGVRLSYPCPSLGGRIVMAVGRSIQAAVGKDLAAGTAVTAALAATDT